MAMIIVYTKPACMQCEQTRRVLQRGGLTEGEDYDVVDVTANRTALTYVTEELGYSAAPVVVLSDDDHWSGFRPDHLRRAISWLQSSPG